MNELVTTVAFVQLHDQPNSLKWDLIKKEVFTLQSLHVFLVNQNAMHLNKFLWKLKLPLKLRFFLTFY